jgi:Zn-dependent protease with chaperone function
MDGFMDALSLLPILVACALPMAGATIMGFVQQLRERRTSGPELPQMAGRWLSALVSKRRMSVRVEVHPHTGIDAYFPGTGAIGLSQRTYASSGAVAYAVAAHELGHAENMAHSTCSPPRAWRAPSPTAPSRHP